MRWCAGRFFAAGRWQHEIQPINQTELAQTGTLFGYVVADGLEKLGVPVSAEEKESYHHLWRYANWLQGVPDALQVASFADEERLHRELGTQFYFPDANSFTLIESLYDALDMQAPFFMPKTLLKAFTANLMQTQLADRISLSPDPLAMNAAPAAKCIARAGLRYQLAAVPARPRTGGWQSLFSQSDRAGARWG
ncbi:MAG: oxygenase MpaB family protein [Turneriella sp.]